jgi:hypothetical protein
MGVVRARGGNCRRVAEWAQVSAFVVTSRLFSDLQRLILNRMPNDYANNID